MPRARRPQIFVDGLVSEPPVAPDTDNAQENPPRAPTPPPEDPQLAALERAARAVERSLPPSFTSMWATAPTFTLRDAITPEPVAAPPTPEPTPEPVSDYARMMERVINSRWPDPYTAARLVLHQRRLNTVGGPPSAGVLPCHCGAVAVPVRSGYNTVSGRYRCHTWGGCSASPDPGLRDAPRHAHLTSADRSALHCSLYVAAGGTSAVVDAWETGTRPQTIDALLPLLQARYAVNQAPARPQVEPDAVASYVTEPLRRVRPDPAGCTVGEALLWTAVVDGLAQSLRAYVPVNDFVAACGTPMPPRAERPARTEDEEEDPIADYDEEEEDDLS